MIPTLRQRWLRSFRVVERPSFELIAFPPAGAGASFYRPWLAHVPSHVALCSVQYPGREDRIQEPCSNDLHALSDDIASALRENPRAPVVLFGHSLGAAIAYEVALRLETRSTVGKLFVSGRPAPQRERHTTVAEASDEALWADVRRLGGTRHSVLENEELRALLLPILREDYALSERYRASAGTRLACDVVACVGDRDSEVDPEEARAWGGLTRGGFTLRTFQGDHFYLLSAAPALVEDVLRLSHVPNSMSRSWPSTP